MFKLSTRHADESDKVGEREMGREGGAGESVEVS